MKKVKLMALILAIAMALILFTACDTDQNENGKELPEFSIEVVDGESTFELTQDDVKELELHKFAVESKDEIFYYQGFKIPDVLNAISELDVEGITSLKAVASDGFGENLDPMPEADFENAYLAIFYSETEDGEFEFLVEDNGPVRLYNTTEGAPKKGNISQVAKLIINRD